MMDQHPICAEDMREIVECFVVETREIFDELDNDLLELERRPDDRELIDQIFRAVHTVKGTSGFLSLEQLGMLAHHYEDVLNRLRRSQIVFHPAMMDVLLAAFDQMKGLLQQVIDRRLAPVDLDALVAALKAISEGSFEAGRAPGAAQAAGEGSPDAPPGVEETGSGPRDAVDAAKGGPARLNRPAAETIRVDVQRLDSLMDLVGELVLSRNRLLQLVSDIKATDNVEDLVRELDETNAQVDFITTELQTAVMRTRMMQIGRVFNKFPRLVRDLAKEFGKEIDLVIEGEETELDKSLVEEISDPLVHLVRNAADHGIETTEERVAKGKPARGRMRLAAAHEGNSVVIEIEDDGAGIDVDRVKQTALEKGLVSAKDVDGMTAAQIFDLLFRPGFSTAHKVGKVSGRGVGMDVVKTNVSRLNGTIRIASTPGRGSRITLTLPLTLAIIQSLLVRAGEETFALPLHAVIEVVDLGRGDVGTIRGREVMRLREQVVPLMRVGEALGVTGYDAGRDRAFAVVVGIAHHRLGLVVDALTGQKEIVIKPLGTYLKKVAGIAGSTILGDGRVIMILDVGGLVRMEQSRRRGAAGQRVVAT